MMKWTVVGFWGGHPEIGEATTAYLLEENGFRLLVDCGSGVLSQLPKYIEIYDLDAVIISHYHFDHIADVGPLQYGRHVGQYIGKPADTLPIYGHQLEPEKFAALTYENATMAVPYQIGEPLKIGPFQIDTLMTVHPAPCAAMRFTNGDTTIVFTADTSFIPELIPFSKDADLLVAECSLYKEHDGASMGHMNTLDVGNLAQKANVKECLLTHLPHYGDHANLLKETAALYDGKLSLAKSGWTWGK